MLHPPRNLCSLPSSPPSSFMPIPRDPCDRKPCFYCFSITQASCSGARELANSTLYVRGGLVHVGSHAGMRGAPFFNDHGRARPHHMTCCLVGAPGIHQEDAQCVLLPSRQFSAEIVASAHQSICGAECRVLHVSVTSMSKSKYLCPNSFAHARLLRSAANPVVSRLLSPWSRAGSRRSTVW